MEKMYYIFVALHFLRNLTNPQAHGDWRNRLFLQENNLKPAGCFFCWQPSDDPFCHRFEEEKMLSS